MQNNRIRSKKRRRFPLETRDQVSKRPKSGILEVLLKELGDFDARALEITPRSQLLEVSFRGVPGTESGALATYSKELKFDENRRRS
ncbi:hypothetical protein L596_014942 [Steinernema carpocapsae]|uniref:Uncharacterized protein n=1 Tax=Steinernema carpocapsae TaxID=34508 RepID=A0A4U5NE13_STECR|nr:hypothetical protein L596_014942 [Steinernema carpocapsae]